MPPIFSILRSAVLYLLGIVSTVIFSLLVILFATVNRRWPWADRMMKTWARSLLILAGTKVTVEGAENIRPDTSYMVIANHQSNLDIMVCLAAIPLPIRFLAKKEVFKIPILAAAMRAAGVVSVDRQATTASSLREINEKAGLVVELGHSLIVYPEGTRSPTRELLPFKKGAFMMASSTGLPILPVTIWGTRELWAPGAVLVRSGRVKVKIDPPIEVAGLKKFELDDLRERLRTQIGERYLELQS